MKKLLLVFLITLITCSFVNAQFVTKTTTRTATGKGVATTHQSALQQAIFNAMSKWGGKISGSQNTSSTVQSVNGASSVHKSLEEDINVATNGKFSSYEIVSENQIGDRYEIVVKLIDTKTTKSYKVPGLDPKNRRSITIFSNSPNFKAIGDDLQQKITANILNSRNFNVLDRQNSGYYEMEKAVVSSGDATSDEILKLKNVLGTDYILLFSVKDAASQKRIDTITGKEKIRSEVLVEYQVLMFATKQVKFANTLALKVNLKDGSISRTNAAMQDIADQITNDIIFAIYPPKIAAMAGNEAVFSQKMSEGLSLECFSLGQKVKNSYTKESAGAIETKTGDITIVRTNPKQSYAKITSGSVKTGDICRPIQNSIGRQNVGVEANYKIEEGKGGADFGW
ncbi:hypothetical protein [Helicobacter winghamensis]|uniref:hypothetical protein n=1 Tax=Helicobacter winghamensis TaxID=157268 RepID=UPI00351B1805